MILALHSTLTWFIIIYDPVSMKLSTISAILSAALASSRTIGVPDRVEHVQDVSIADVFGDKIPGQSPVTFCKGDRSKDAVCIELHLSQSPIPYLTSFDCSPAKSFSGPAM